MHKNKRGAGTRIKLQIPAPMRYVIKLSSHGHTKHMIELKKKPLYLKTHQWWEKD
jgi:hypothetical protein